MSQRYRWAWSSELFIACADRKQMALYSLGSEATLLCFSVNSASLCMLVYSTQERRIFVPVKLQSQKPFVCSCVLCLLPGVFYWLHTFLWSAKKNHNACQWLGLTLFAVPAFQMSAKGNGTMSEETIEGAPSPPLVTGSRFIQSKPLSEGYRHQFFF